MSNKVAGYVAAVAILAGTYVITDQGNKINKLKEQVPRMDSTIKDYEAFVRADSNIKKAFIVRGDSIRKAAMQHKIDSIKVAVEKTESQFLKSLKKVK